MDYTDYALHKSNTTSATAARVIFIIIVIIIIFNKENIEAAGDYDKILEDLHKTWGSGESDSQRGSFTYQDIYV